MNVEKLQSALEIYEQLKKANEAVKKLEKELDPFKTSIKEEMGKEGKKLIESTKGYATWVDKKGNTKWDVEALEKELGDDVENFRTVKEASHYIKFGLYADSNEEQL